MKLKAIKASALLSALFMVVYGSCNYLTSLRHDVGTFYFAWERHIPFVPLMIIPYMSIDLFFIAAPFLCRDERELKTLSRRIIGAILIVAACFLLFPLRFAFDRPHVYGPLGLIFNNFRLLDRPFNQFPSLHITLRTILAVLYVHHTGGLTRLAARVWFSLIGFSTLLTYQHHVIDLVGGFALAAICLYLWDEQPLRQPVVSNRRVGAYYAAGALALIAFATVTRPWGWLLLLPALSLAILAGAYFGLGPGVFRKSNGKLAFVGRLMLWPVLLGQRLSLLYYASKSPAWNAVTDRLWIGRKLSNPEARQAMNQGVTAVLDLSGEFSEAAPFRQINYRQLSVMDLTAPTPAQLDQAVAFLCEQPSSGVVYVHCKAGYSRTAAVVGAYLLATGQADTAEQAATILRARRPGVVIRPEAFDAIRQYQSCLSSCMPMPSV